MYYSKLSSLEPILSWDQINRLDGYFASLSRSAKSVISVSKISSVIRIDSSLAMQALTKEVEEGLLKISYSIRCPECGMLIKKIDNPNEFPENPFECYSCNQDIEVTPEDIEVLYELCGDSDPFQDGQHGKMQDEKKDPERVAPIDTLASMLQSDGLNLNSMIFKPTEEQYLKMNEIFDSIFGEFKTTTEKGGTLENLIIFLFNICRPSICANGIRTKTNQFDCFCMNRMYIQYGVLGKMGLHFIVECKNENKVPSGSYMSKLHSIIVQANAGTQRNMNFGMLVTKKSGPKTFKTLSHDYYLSSKLTIIFLNAEDLTFIIKKRYNLLDMIQTKISEIELNVTTDLIGAGFM